LPPAEREAARKRSYSYNDHVCIVETEDELSDAEIAALSAQLDAELR
jgi:hypothetical protein